MKHEVIRGADKYTGDYSPGATFICDEADRIKDLTDRGIIKKQDLNPDAMTKKEIMSMLGEKALNTIQDRQKRS